MQKQKNQHGFTTIDGVLVFLVLSSIWFTARYLWQHQPTTASKAHNATHVTPAGVSTKNAPPTYLSNCDVISNACAISVKDGYLSFVNEEYVVSATGTGPRIVVATGVNKDIEKNLAQKLNYQQLSYIKEGAPVHVSLNGSGEYRLESCTNSTPPSCTYVTDLDKLNSFQVL